MPQVKVGDRYATLILKGKGLERTLNGRVVHPGAHLHLDNLLIELDGRLSKAQIARAAFAAGVRVAQSESPKTSIEADSNAA